MRSQLRPVALHTRTDLHGTIVITGGAGFIGSNLAEAVLDAGYAVRVLDNLSTGAEVFLESARRSPRFEMIRCDLVDDQQRLPELMAGAAAVVHLAANADVRHGWSNPTRDVRENVVATQNVLEAMRQTGVRQLVFSSTGSVYGEAPLIPTPEDCPFPLQTSLYGASKVAAEGLISAYTEGCDLRATIFRFVSNLCPRYTHGHVIDFTRQLLADPGRIRVLGDGSQRKSYIHVADTCTAIVAALRAEHRLEVYNLGTEGYCSVRESLSWICDRLGVSPVVEFEGGDRGWVGDNPFIYLDTQKLRATGWRSRHSIRDAIVTTVDYILANRWVLDLAEARV